MRYVNNGYTTKTFYGVEFKPGDEKEVPGYINSDGMFRTDIFDSSKADEQKADKKAEQATEPVAEAETEKPTRKSKTSTKKGDE